MKRKQKTIGIIFIIIVTAAAISAVSVTIALLNSDKMKATGDALSRLRTLMRGGTELGFEELYAYIIPSDDAHQVGGLFKKI
jgi:hypothetical protein